MIAALEAMADVESARDIVFADHPGCFATEDLNKHIDRSAAILAACDEAHREAETQNSKAMAMAMAMAMKPANISRIVNDERLESIRGRQLVNDATSWLGGAQVLKAHGARTTQKEGPARRPARSRHVSADVCIIIVDN